MAMSFVHLFSRSESMRICAKLFNDINFEPDAVQPCCNVHGIRVPRFPFKGGALDMPAYAQHIGNVVDELQGNSPLCRSCPDLEEMEIPNGQHLRILFRTVSINMHRFQCNCRCVYCSLWRHEGASVGYRILPALQSLAEQHVLHKECFFSWGGGEPSILKEFEETSSWIGEHGYPQYVHTNALRYSPTVEGLLRDGVAAVNISLDSASPDVYRAVKGVDGFARVVEHVKGYVLAASDPTSVHLKYIIFAKNNAMKHIERFLELCCRLHVHCVQYSLNFEELKSGGAQTQSLLGAAFFRHRAAALGLKAWPFFIPPAVLATIESLEKQHFSEKKQLR